MRGDANTIDRLEFIRAIHIHTLTYISAREHVQGAAHTQTGQTPGKTVLVTVARRLLLDVHWLLLLLWWLLLVVLLLLLWRLLVLWLLLLLVLRLLLLLLVVLLLVVLRVPSLRVVPWRRSGGTAIL